MAAGAPLPPAPRGGPGRTGWSSNVYSGRSAVALVAAGEGGAPREGGAGCRRATASNPALTVSCPGCCTTCNNSKCRGGHTVGAQRQAHPTVLYHHCVTSGLNGVCTESLKAESQHCPMPAARHVSLRTPEEIEIISVNGCAIDTISLSTSEGVKAGLPRGEPRVAAGDFFYPCGFLAFLPSVVQGGNK